LEGGAADGTEGKALLLYLYQANFAESVAAVEVARDVSVTVEVLIAAWAFHLLI
jgi:hypothetical protein